MSWRRITLPDYETVLKWDTKEVLQWLQKNGLPEFSEFVTKSSLTGDKLLTFGEAEIFFHQDFVDVNVVKKKQLAKCVKECKNQASHAKKKISKCISECKVQANSYKRAMNNSLKSKKEKNLQQTSSNGDQDSDQSDNGWDTDFEDNSEDEEPETSIGEEETPDNEAGSGLRQHSHTPKQNGVSKMGSYNMRVQNQDFNSDEIPQNSPMVVLKQIKRYPDAISNDDIPKEMPPAKPQISPKPKIPIPEPPTTNFQELRKKLNNSSVINNCVSPLRRPSTEPPAPPIPIVSATEQPPLPLTLPYEDNEYEAPIEFRPQPVPSAFIRTYPESPYPSSNSSISDSQDNSEQYEIISNPDDSGTGSLDTINNANEFRLTRMNSNNVLNNQVPAAGPATVDSYLTPPLPVKSKVKSSSSIAIMQSKLASLKISTGKSNNSNSQLNSKPLPPKPNGIKLDSKILPPKPTAEFVTRVPLSPDINLHPALNGKRSLPTPPPLTEGVVLDKQPYYHNIERPEAEQLVLRLLQDGAFLVRPSQKGGANNPFTLTLVQSGKAFHLNIRNKKGKYALGREKPNEKVFNSIPEMISYHRNTPIYVTSHDCRGQECHLKVHPKRQFY